MSDRLDFRRRSAAGWRWAGRSASRLFLLFGVAVLLAAGLMVVGVALTGLAQSSHRVILPQMPKDATVTPTPTPTSTPTPTVTPTPTITPTPPPVAPDQYRVTRAEQVHNCGTTYVRGFVLDQSGFGVNGVKVRTWNDWGNVYVSESGCCGRETGHWDRVFHGGAVAGTWYAAVIDDLGRIVSPTHTIVNTADCSPGAGVQETRLDWQRN